MIPEKRPHRWLYLLMLAVLALPLFLHLGRAPLSAWDEALFAMRAAYMAEEGHYLPDYDHWISKGAFHPNSKPPFTTWIQAGFLKLFGINELALRLPVALAALGTLLLLGWFFKRKMDAWPAAAFVLVTTLGYVREHGARTGDQDAPLALYMLTGVLAFYLLLRSDDKKEQRKWWVVLALSTLAAMLTKYLFGALFLPGMALYALYKNKWPWLWRQRALWAAALSVLLLCGGWVAFMEFQRPGFAQRVIFYEMLNRYTSVIEEHSAPWYFYLQNMWKGYFQPWVWLLPVPVAMLFTKTEKKWKDLIVLLLLCSVFHLAVISSSQTKVPHYDVVLYPLLAMLAGIGLWRLSVTIIDNWTDENQRPVMAGLAVAVLLLLLVNPYVTVLKQVYHPKLTRDDYKYGYLFREIEARHPNLKSFKLLAPVFEAQAVYYAGLFVRTKGYEIELEDFPKRVEVGDTIMVCNRNFIDFLFKNYRLQGLASYEQCFVARVEEKLE